MTPPETDPYADGGGSAWEVQPAVPGWSAGQDFYTGPLFDDTGWHIDLSNVDWAGSAADREQAGRTDDDSYGGPGASWRNDRRDGQAGNGAAPYAAERRPRDGRTRAWPRQPDRLDRADGQGGPDQQARSTGRHARRVGSGEDPAARVGERPTRPGRRRAGPPMPARPRRPGEPTRHEPGYPPRDFEPPGYQRPVYDAPPYDRPPDARAPAFEPPVYEPPWYEPPGYEPAPQRRQGLPPETHRPGGGARGPGGSARPPGTRGTGPGVAPAHLPVDATGSFSIARSSSVMAIGTLGSRLTGFLRQIVQSSALAVGGIAAAYNLSNTLPNVVYNLALGGILTSVIVPLIVNAAKRDSGRSDGYDQRMFTLITAALAAVTLVATALAVPIVHLYAGSKITESGATLHLAVLFALFFIPQIFFYGVSSLIGAILNARGSFAAPCGRRSSTTSWSSRCWACTSPWQA